MTDGAHLIIGYAPQFGMPIAETCANVSAELESHYGKVFARKGHISVVRCGDAGVDFDRKCCNTF